MSNEMATIPDQLPAHLQQYVNPEVAEEFESGVAGGFPLPFLSVRGKEFRLRKDGQEYNTRLRELPVVMIAARPTLSKRYYDKQYATGSIDAPRCSSRDAITPDVAEPINDKCATCPMNAWGSRVTESGKQAKACQDYKRIVVWPLELTQEPLVLDVAATSLRAPKGQAGNVMMLRDYTQVLRKHNMSPHMVVTKLQFTDAEYPQVCFAFERFVKADELQKALALRESEEVQTVIGEDLHESAAATEATPTKAPPVEPAEQKEPAPKARKAARAKPSATKEEPAKAPDSDVVYVWHDEWETGGAVPRKQLGTYQKDGYVEVDKRIYERLTAGDGKKPEAAEPASKQEAANPAPKQEAAPAASGNDEDALYAEVEKLLKGG